MLVPETGPAPARQSAERAPYRQIVTRRTIQPSPSIQSRLRSLLQLAASSSDSASPGGVGDRADVGDRTDLARFRHLSGAAIRGRSGKRCGRAEQDEAEAGRGEELGCHGYPARAPPEGRAPCA